ncbi:ead/Ea22-like family protein [Pseudomonas folii]|uniref:Ead/Ea22-like family protein n=1 Tax=Pseudomonas folii TaxID=2762593 RepID=A0ABR7ATU8_9PSED|nr:ead/Ea22-like family protein [Pseudomonas folii]MBC3948332.1 ead/Ea22-like family protein [Pseudomonas folii]
MNNYSELKQVAEAAPSGPWIAENDTLYFKDDGYTRHLLDADAGHDVSDEAYYAALKFIAAAHPASVLALIAENEALRQDAERYRWLREGAQQDVDGWRNDVPVLVHALSHVPEWKERLDKYIDAAMSKGSGQ